MAPDGSFQGCLAEVLQAHGEGATNEDATASLEQVDIRAARLMRRDGLSRDDAIREAGKQLAAEEELAAARAKANKLGDEVKRRSRRERIGDVAGIVGDANKTGVVEAVKRGVRKVLGRKEPMRATADVAKAIENQITAIHARVPGARLTAERVWKTRSSEYTNGMMAEFEKAGLTKYMRDQRNSAAWGREVYERSMQAAGEDAEPGVTKDDQANAAADIVHKYTTLAKSRVNAEGAWIGDYPGWVTSTSHDPDKIHAAGLDRWKEVMNRGLDHDRTFEEVDNPDAMLTSSYHAFVHGDHLSDADRVGFKDPAFTGPSNLARKASEERVYHFKDFDSWHGYQTEFGSGTLLEQVLGGLDRSARQEALLQRWGTKPLAEFEADIKYFKQELHSRDPEAVLALSEAEHRLTGLFSVLDGTANKAVNRQFARLASNARTLKSLASLGGVVLSHLSSAVTKAAVMRHQGISPLESYANFAKHLVVGRGVGEGRRLADNMHAGMEGIHGDMLSRFQIGDTVPGTLSKVANRFFKVGLLTRTLDGQKAGAEALIARHLGRLVDTEHGALPGEVQRALTAYDISPSDWDALRTAPGHFTSDDGRKFLTPDAAMRSTTGLSDRAKDQLGMKLHAYYSDLAEQSVVTPTIGDRYTLMRATKPGTPEGELARSMAQFKTWGVAASRQVLGREFYSGQGMAGAASGVMQLAAGMYGMGYLISTLKNLAGGIDPGNPLDPKVITASLLQGGGFGILGDFMFGEMSRTGGGIGETLLGPILGESVAQVMNLYGDFKSEATDPKQRQAKDIGPDMLKMGQGWAPFVNLFYVRMLTNYLFVHALQEKMNPGYLRRHEQSMKRLQGKTYFLSPARAQSEGLGAMQMPQIGGR